jgi:hypothetical protein
MAQTELRFRHRLSIIASIVMIALLSGLLTACLVDEGPVGMSLLFQSTGDEVLVQKFDFDGQRGPVPGVVSARTRKHMTFMPGDSKRGVPSYVDVGWLIWTDEYKAWSESIEKRPEGERYIYTPEGRAEYQREWAKNLRYERRIDLRPIITPELIAKVRADRRGSLLKLIITFNNDEVDIKAEVEKWR